MEMDIHGPLAKQIVNGPAFWSCNPSAHWTFSAVQRRPTVSDMIAAVCPDLVDTLIELYCDWRTECAQVQAAYERFSDAEPDDRTLTFAAYAAALDREESACESYAAQIRLIERWCSGSSTPSRGRKAQRA